MKRKNILILIITISCMLVQIHTHAGTPGRIISLKPNITELLFAIGAGDQLVGATTWCDRPEAAKKLPRVADYIKPNIEKIIALQPDLVVTSEENSIKTPIEVMRRSGIPTLLLPFNTVSDLFDSTMRLAEATGHTAEGRRLINNLRMALYPRRQTQDLKPRTLIVVGMRPLIAAGPDTFLSEVVEIAGGKNIISSKILYPYINMETVIAKDPDVILDLSMGSEHQRSWQNYPLTAVKKRQVYTLNISDFRIGPGLAEQIERLRPLLSKRD